MRYSKMFGKTKKTGRRYDSINATYLIQGGFIDQTMAGVYTFLPLGWRVLTKIENIIREEMNALGEEILMPSLSPEDFWKTTGRLNQISVLMKARGGNPVSLNMNKTEYVLNSTHEDVVVPLAKKFALSYRDFPFAVYQIQTKFRNEPRPKSGILRCREFRMKDLYSFHTDVDDFKRFYEEVKRVYMKIFQRIGIGDDTVITLASGGDFTQEYSHEFQTLCETGEDTIFIAKKANRAFNQEIAPSKAPEIYDKEKELPMQEVKGEGIIGAEALSEFLQIPVYKTTKTILFQTEAGDVIAAVVRGNYDVNVKKLLKIVGCKKLVLADAQTVQQVTGAQVGYAGIIGLPKDVRIYFDESVKGRKNFECGANKTDYHLINVNFGRDIPEPKEYYDIKIAQPGDYYPETKERYDCYQAVEVGNIFPLYTKFTEPFHFVYTDEKGRQKPVIMGSYGIGSTRILGVCVEKFHDDRGIIWPKSIAPYQVHLLVLSSEKNVMKYAEKHYRTLLSAGIEVLYDDRENVSPGEKFADADLIGIPYRLVVSRKTADMVEKKKRHESRAKVEKMKTIIQEILSEV